MKNLLKCLFLFIFSLVLVTSCSDDDDNGDNTFTINAEGIYHSVIEVQWTPINGAYMYQIFYQKDGDTEWKESNYIMSENYHFEEEEGVIWELYNLSPLTKYKIYVKAYKDSQRNILATSNQVEATTYDVPE